MTRTTHNRLLIFILLAAVAAAQEKPSGLTVVGRDGKQAVFSVEQLRKMPRQVVEVTDPQTKAGHQYEGVLLSSLLQQVGTPSGEALRGSLVRNYVEAAGRQLQSDLRAGRTGSDVSGQQSHCCRHDGRRITGLCPRPATVGRSPGSPARALGPHAKHGQRTAGTLSIRTDGYHEVAVTLLVSARPRRTTQVPWDFFGSNRSSATAPAVDLSLYQPAR